MPRIRTIKPEFFTSLTVSQVSRDARLTFIGLWTYCDDEGRGRDEPRLLKAALWPLDDEVTTAAVERHLTELAGAQLIQRYTVAGSAYLSVTNWKEHQKIDRPRSSSYPKPTNPRAKQGEASTMIRRTVDEPSLLEGRKEGKGKERKEPLREESTNLFEEAWTAYPQRPNNSKAAALRQWEARVKADESPEEMLRGTQAYATFVQREHVEPRYIKLAATFYGRDRHYLSDFAGPPVPEDEVVENYDWVDEGVASVQH